MPHSISQNPDPHSPWSQNFPLLRNQEAAWGSEELWRAAGLAGFLLLLLRRICWRSSAAVRRRRGRNISSWRGLLREAGEKSGVKYGTVEPLGRGWAGLVLLARAAAYAKERDNYTTLFDEKTFEPMIAGPPFVRALSELVEAAKLGPKEQLDSIRRRHAPSSGKARRRWQSVGRVQVRQARSQSAFSGRHAERACYFRANCPARPRSTALQRHLGTAERRCRPARPAAGHCRTDGRGPSGERTRRCGLPASALAKRSAMEPQVFAGSPATTLFRSDQIAAAKSWVESGISASAARQYAEQTAATLSRSQFLASLRLPGRAEYLRRAGRCRSSSRARAADADRSVKSRPPTSGAKSASGMDAEKQKAAYMHSLGLD